jgi:hypothetical protein
MFAYTILSGCGLTVPDLKEIGDHDIPPRVFPSSSPDIPPKKLPKITGTAQIEYEIVQRIFCDLQKAVHAANGIPVGETEGGTPFGKVHPKYPGLFPPDWAAQVALSLEVDETLALNPGVAFNEVMPNAIKAFGPGTTGSVVTPQSFTFGFGGNVSSTATRIDKFNPYWSIERLSEPTNPYSKCQDPENDWFVKQQITPAASSPLIESDLGIEDWLVGAMIVNDLVPSTPQLASQSGAPGKRAPAKRAPTGPTPAGQAPAGQGGAKPESISIEIKFIIVTSGNVTPTWKLLRISANTGASPFFSTGRTRTHDLIITIGPNTTQTNNSHLASQINAKPPSTGP